MCENQVSKLTTVQQSVDGKKLCLDIIHHDTSNLCFEFIVNNMSACLTRKGIFFTIIVVICLATVNVLLPNFYAIILFIVIVGYFFAKLLWDVKSESVLLIAPVGLQLTATFQFGQQTSHFIPWNFISDVIINEAITGHRVVYYLAVIVEQPDNTTPTKKLIPLFQYVIWHLKCRVKNICVYHTIIKSLPLIISALLIYQATIGVFRTDLSESTEAAVISKINTRHGLSMIIEPDASYWLRYKKYTYKFTFELKSQQLNLNLKTWTQELLDVLKIIVNEPASVPSIINTEYLEVVTKTEFLSRRCRILALLEFKLSTEPVVLFPKVFTLYISVKEEQSGEMVSPNSNLQDSNADHGRNEDILSNLHPCKDSTVNKRENNFPKKQRGLGLRRSISSSALQTTKRRQDECQELKLSTCDRKVSDSDDRYRKVSDSDDRNRKVSDSDDRNTQNCNSRQTQTSTTIPSKRRLPRKRKFNDTNCDEGSKTKRATTVSSETNSHLSENSLDKVLQNYDIDNTSNASCDNLSFIDSFPVCKKSKSLSSLNEQLSPKESEFSFSYKIPSLREKTKCLSFKEEIIGVLKDRTNTLESIVNIVKLSVIHKNVGFECDSESCDNTKGVNCVVNKVEAGQEPDTTSRDFTEMECETKISNSSQSYSKDSCSKIQCLTLEQKQDRVEKEENKMIAVSSQVNNSVSKVKKPEPSKSLDNLLTNNVVDTEHSSVADDNEEMCFGNTEKISAISASTTISKENISTIDASALSNDKMVPSGDLSERNELIPGVVLPWIHNEGKPAIKMATYGGVNRKIIAMLASVVKTVENISELNALALNEDVAESTNAAKRFLGSVNSDTTHDAVANSSKVNNAFGSSAVNNEEKILAVGTSTVNRDEIIPVASSTKFDKFFAKNSNEKMSSDITSAVGNDKTRLIVNDKNNHMLAVVLMTSDKKISALGCSARSANKSCPPVGISPVDSNKKVATVGNNKKIVTFNTLSESFVKKLFAWSSSATNNDPFFSLNGNSIITLKSMGTFQNLSAICLIANNSLPPCIPALTYETIKDIPSSSTKTDDEISTEKLDEESEELTTERGIGMSFGECLNIFKQNLDIVNISRLTDGEDWQREEESESMEVDQDELTPDRTSPDIQNEQCCCVCRCCQNVEEEVIYPRPLEFTHVMTRRQFESIIKTSEGKISLSLQDIFSTDDSLGSESRITRSMVGKVSNMKKLFRDLRSYPVVVLHRLDETELNERMS